MDNLFLKQEDFERIFKAHLKIETYSKSIDSLFGPRMLNRIDYSPYYQRNYVWDKHKASYFIESILLGTEIPPLIFFNNGKDIEVIDGRQRFETINRFMNNEFALTEKGLATLKQLSKNTYNDLGKDSSRILDIFLDAKIRIIEFEIVNEPRLDLNLEDKIKKEIFGRYNTGITPLKKAEIDNAIYDKEPISIYFKQSFKEDRDLVDSIHSIFFKTRVSGDVSVETILQFTRRFLVLHMFPINYYARGTSRTEILAKLFEFYSDTIEDVEGVFNSFIHKINIIKKIYNEAKSRNANINRYVYECIFWGLFVLENEELDLSLVDNNNFINDLLNFVCENEEKYSEIDTHYYVEIMRRYSVTRDFLEDRLGVDLSVYLSGTEKERSHLKEIRKYNEDDQVITKLSELEHLRVTKPDPSRESIDDVVRKMNRRRFLVRPSYQRSEVINIPKASRIIESILLGIMLPAIFIYKREDGISEVIDGQQRLLTILGYIGESYVDTENNTCLTKNNKFSLRGLNILTDLNGKKFEDLDSTLQNRILDFELFTVEIEERVNPEFNPVDLFIRLNDKPFPIRENSFEMWNSWADRDIIVTIKENVKKHLHWFYVKVLNRENDRDRMQNEEIYTSLSYLYYKKSVDTKPIYLDVYQKTDRINARLKEKRDITNVLTTASQNIEEKQKLLASIKNTEGLIKKLKIILLDKNIEDKDKLNNYYLKELNKIFKAGSKKRYVVRTMQDFYIIWLLLNDLNLEMVKFHRLEMKKDVKAIFYYMKNIPEEEYENSVGFQKFNDLLKEFKDKYKKDSRKIRLSESEKNQLILNQDNKCAISGAPIFVGDEIEVDHKEPLSIGGSDEKNNLQITHKEENRKKGPRIK